MKTRSAILLMALLIQAWPSAAAPGDEFWDNRYAAVGGPGFDRGVRAILVHDSNVYVGGGFTQIGGVAASNIAKWDGTNWSALGSGLDGPAYSLAARRNDLYAGGRFESAGGTAAANVARWNGVTWSPVGLPPFAYAALAVAVSTNGNEVYAGHAVLPTAGGHYIFKFDGTDWAPLGGGVLYNSALSTPVAALLVDGDDVYVGGEFWNVGGVTITNLARWDGTNWWPVGGGVDFYFPEGGTTLVVASLAMADGKLYVGGNFNRAGGLAGQQAGNIARWDGSSWFTFNGGVDFVVRALAVNGDEVYAAGGSYMYYDPRIAKWDGTKWVVLGGGLGDSGSGPALALSLRGADLFVGGLFSSAGGQPAANLSIWHIPQTLAVFRAGGNLQISWPTQALSYVLQAAPTLPGASWNAVDQAPQIIDDRYTVTTNLTGDRQFFRLIHP